MNDNNDANGISEWNLLNDIRIPSNHVKNTNSHYYPILHGYINTCRGKSKV